MRPYHYLCLVLWVLFMATGGIVLHVQYRTHRQLPMVRENQRMTLILGLSDLVLSTEAGYIRHLSLTDFVSPFQDTPAGFDLFPSWSFFSPPRNMLPYKRNNKNGGT